MTVDNVRLTASQVEQSMRAWVVEIFHAKSRLQLTPRLGYRPQQSPNPTNRAPVAFVRLQPSF
jgi:hypothetical protein